MNPFTFTAHFGDEDSCRLDFKAQRERLGIVCKKCGCTEHYWKQDKWSHECKSCKFRTSLRSGTILESSRLPFLVWYRTMFLMNATKKGFSAKEIQRLLGLKRYEPVWTMVFKLNKAMGERDARYTLEGMIEFDETYFTVLTSEIEKSKTSRKVAVLPERAPMESSQTGQASKQVRYFRARVQGTRKWRGDIDGTIQESLNAKTIVYADEDISYVDISDYVELHIAEKSTKESKTENLKWVYILISNTKTNLMDNYHKIKGKYLQLYLNEFVCKLNRRYFDEQIFDRVVVAAITNT